MMTNKKKCLPWQGKRSKRHYNRNEEKSILTDEDIMCYFSQERFRFYYLKCSFEDCRRRLREIFKDDQKALELIDKASSYQELIKSFISKPSDVHSPYGKVLADVTNLHPVFLDWIADPYWDEDRFPFLNFDEEEFLAWEESKKEKDKEEKEG